MQSAPVRCPKCDSYMLFEVEYVAGKPVMRNVCPSCGYDNSDSKTYATDHATEFRNHIINTKTD